MKTGRYKMWTKDGITRLALEPDMKPDVIAPPVSLATVLKTKTDAVYPFPSIADPSKRRTADQVIWWSIHHSAGSRDSQSIDWWHQYHTESKSWSRAGYHYGIAPLHRGGEIGLYEINPWQEFTWHDARNFDTFAVCFAGTMMAGYDVEPNEVQLDYFGQLAGWVLPQLPNLAGIVGHFRWGQTACPGDLSVWGHKLIDAAAKYQQGDRVRDLLAYGKASATTRALSFARAAMPGTPPLSDYDEHAGLHLPE